MAPNVNVQIRKIRLFPVTSFVADVRKGVENPLTMVCVKLYKYLKKHINIVVTRMGILKKQKKYQEEVSI